MECLWTKSQGNFYGFLTDSRHRFRQSEKWGKKKLYFRLVFNDNMMIFNKNNLFCSFKKRKPFFFLSFGVKRDNFFTLVIGY